MNQILPRSTSIGHIAYQNLLRNHSALVSGISSRGIYLQPEGDLTLYLTDDPCRGPLTINLQGSKEIFHLIQIGDGAFFNQSGISFTEPNIAIQLEKPLIWEPGLAPRSLWPPSPARDQIISQALEIAPDHPYLPLLQTVVWGEPIPIDGLPGITAQLIGVQDSLNTAYPSQILAGLERFLGAGPGLTPVGDDLILGILLAVVRARKYRAWTGDIIHFNHSLLTNARERTTRVSWSLLSCAVQGSADERIIRVLDGLIAGREIPPTDLKNLLDWGSSSGIAVLAGMMLGLG